MTRSTRPPTPLAPIPPEAHSRSNGWQMELVPIDQIKVPIKALKPTGPEAIALCKGHMQRSGQPRPLIVTDDLVLIDGLDFLVAAKELGWPDIYVAPLSGLSETDVVILRLALAKLPYLSDWDEEVLSFDLQTVIKFEPDFIDLTGFQQAEIDVRLDTEPVGSQTDPADLMPVAPVSGETVSRLGDEFHLGVHKIRCGDSQEFCNILILLDGENARAVITDPPYNIPIANNVSGLGKKKHEDFAMAVGEMSRDTFTKFLSTMFFVCKGCLVSGGLFYVFMGRRQLEELLTAARLSGMKYLDLAIWDKGSGGMGSFLRSQFEACGIFKYDDHPHVNNIQLGRFGRYRTNVWKHPGFATFGKGRAEALASHPTCKPVNLIADIIKDSTKRGDIILDLFLGAGSTILAAHRTGRRCYGIEFDPQYVDIAIRRWETLSGVDAIHDGTRLTFAELRLQRLGQQKVPHLVDATSSTEADNDR